MKDRLCQCADPGCPYHPGTSICIRGAKHRLFRVDMWLDEGTLFCEACAADALMSGLFDEAQQK